MGTRRPPSFPIQVFLFDMDGLLLDTEDIYVRVRQEVIDRNGGSKTIPWAMAAEMQSMPGVQNDMDIISYAGLTISFEQYRKEQFELQLENFKFSKLLPGVRRVFDILDGGLSNPPHFALASASSKKKYAMKTLHHDAIFHKFDPGLLVLGGDERIPVGRGKPHPDIFLLALKIINQKVAPHVIKPEDCLVFEDSKAGVIGARAAGMRVVWIPHREIRKVHLGREEEFLSWPMGVRAHCERESKGELVPVSSNASVPSSVELDNGWIELLDTMENFQFEKYGLNKVSKTNS